MKGRLSIARDVSEINQTSTAILKNGYYEVNGFKFTEFYYSKLWGEGGGQAPSLVAKAVLENSKIAVPDSFKAGFFRYEWDKWEMIYNPKTKEVWHLSYIKQK